MLKPRCTGHCLIYNDEIYVFGGYTAQYKRSRVFERYNYILNTWTPFDLKMDIGIECCLLMSGPCVGEFSCIGGNFLSGRTTSVRTYNIVNKTISTELGNLVKQRILLKGFSANKSIFIFGGDNPATCEECNLEDRFFKICQYPG